MQSGPGQGISLESIGIMLSRSVTGSLIRPGTRWTYRRTFSTLRQPSGTLPNHLPWFPTFRSVVRCPFRCPFRCPTFRSVVPFRSALSHYRDSLARAAGADTHSPTCIEAWCIIPQPHLPQSDQIRMCPLSETSDTPFGRCNCSQALPLPCFHDPSSWLCYLLP